MMLKHGKRELRESTAAQARKKMKRTLLYTYFTSLACLVLCCAMFLGTTMAWFSDDVTNSGNVIQVGTLSAALYHVKTDKDGKESKISLNEHPEHPVFDTSFKWAPEKSQTEVLEIVNEGDLDFKYDLSLLLTSTADVDKGTPLTLERQLALLSMFKVSVRVHDGTSAVSTDETGWIDRGTLDDFLDTTAPAAVAEGESGTDGASTEVAIGVTKEILLHSGELIPNVTIKNGSKTGTSVRFIEIKIEMIGSGNDDSDDDDSDDDDSDDDDSNVMGQSFTINVKLTATQVNSSEAVPEEGSTAEGT